MKPFLSQQIRERADNKVSNTVKEEQNSKLSHKHAPFSAFIILPLEKVRFTLTEDTTCVALISFARPQAKERHTDGSSCALDAQERSRVQ